MNMTSLLIVQWYIEEFCESILSSKIPDLFIYLFS